MVWKWAGCKRPFTFCSLGALQAHVGQLSGKSLPHISLSAEPDPLPPLSAAVEVAGYRIGLEAINNVVRHAQATHCDICLLVEGNGRFHKVGNGSAQLVIKIKDDGVGIPHSPKAGVGLTSMRERAEELGSRLVVGKGKKGTELSVYLPLR